MPDPQSSWICLRSDDLTAEVDPRGAQLSVLKDRKGRDLLWDGDPAIWAGRAPILFPIVGELANGTYRLGGMPYHLSRHGFARHSAFHTVASSAGTAVLRLTADAATLPLYPFRFELDIEFALQGPTLTVTAWVRNLGDEPLPASFGYHPAFRWPLPYGADRSSHVIEFATEEPDPVRRLDDKGLLSPELHPTPVVGRRLVLDDALFRHDALIFDAVRSRSVTYGAAQGPRIRLNFADAPYLGVWSKPQANFICIEPWHGIADPPGYTGDFADKPGVFQVAAGTRAAITMAITLQEAFGSCA